MKSKHYIVGAALIGLAAVFVGAPLIMVRADSIRLKTELGEITAAAHLRNLPQLQQVLNQTEGTLANVLLAGRLLFYAKAIPHWGAVYGNVMNLVAGGYDVSKAASLTLSALPPHLNSHGLKSLIRDWPTVTSHLRPVVPWVSKAASALALVNRQDLPGALRGQWPHIMQLRETLQALARYSPLIIASGPVVDTVMGENHPQRYLVMFENSGELRATGGFLTAYGYLELNKGKITAMSAQNTYALLSRIRYRPPAPPPIAKYVYTPTWHLRDANWSPNVPTAVAKIYQFYDSIPKAPPVAGTFLVTTWFVDRLLADVGPVAVATGSGTVMVTAQNANYQMEYMAEKSGLSQTQRKAFIGTMMKAVLERAFAAKGKALEKILGTVVTGLNQKLLLLYFGDTKAEQLTQQVNWGGTIDRHVFGNYLEVVDENLGGHKDNFYIKEYVRVTIVRRLETIRITWVNPAAPDNNWLVVPYSDWVRVYLPLGTKLLGIEGQNGAIEQYTNSEVDKFVVGTHVTEPIKASASAPPASGTLVFRVELPQKLSLTSFTIQKQPGVPVVHYLVQIGSHSRIWDLREDTRLTGL
ncbi:MAG: hypothetical protein C7B46_09645 [Sulfobacillus benefaciens]|uniref:DUF4012 domain-containing protein n=1 Tax=Sulfobacillus benefaciens TaxID=453960 RepID=A0A2T2XGH0_9FIRM|nr:MAG: hypothetical protein C7B46_09645 [Sulfobacillus benefaciens]